MTTTASHSGEPTDLAISTSNIGNTDSGKSKLDPAIGWLVYTSAKIVIGIVGVLGNLMVLIILKMLDSQRVKFLIGSQAFIDLITSVMFITQAFIRLYPPTIPHNPILGYLYCLCLRFETIVYVLFALSTYNLVAISIERYILVLHPLRYRAYFTRNKEILLGISAWIFSPILQLIFAVAQEDYDPEKHKCVYKPFSNKGLTGIILFLWDFAIPCLIMSFCFSSISVKLYMQDKKAKIMKGHSSMDMPTISSTVLSSDDALASSASNLGSAPVSAKQGAESQKSNAYDKEKASRDFRRSRNVTITFVITFAVYVICWSTNQLLFLQSNLGGYNHRHTPESYFANTMAILNSAVNPFIYILHMKQYQDILKTLFGCR